MKEKDMYEPVKTLLKKIYNITDNDIYAEVNNTDILILKGKCNVIVEMKMSLNLKLIEQAYRAKKYAHYVFVAIPSKSAKNNFFAEYELLIKKGIGIIYVSEYGGVNLQYHDIIARLSQSAKFNHIKDYKLIRKGIKNFSNKNIGGSKSGENITEYSQTIDRIKKYLKRKDDWVSIDEILEHCETHYCNPRQSVSQTLQANWNKNWCETCVINKKRYFKLKNESLSE